MYYFNYKSGQIFESLPNEEILFFHLPIKYNFKPDCKKCNGKFHIGFDTIKNQYVLCPKCTKKFLDQSKYKGSGENQNSKI